MMIGLLFAAALAVPAQEAELEAKLPEIFAKSAAHYLALDEAAAPLMKGEMKKYRGEQQSDLYVPHGWNKWRSGKDELDMRSVFWWTSGHFPGSLWYLYEATGDERFKERALAWTEILAPNSKVTDNHDVGFIMYCSYGNARRILKTDKYDELLKETAESLCKRYNEKLGLIRSWGKIDEKKDFLVIPDNLMNLELLEWAGGRCAEIAVSHSDVTMKHHFRPDGGCRHVLNYDQETGRVKEIRRGQGASCETAWSRGQSWGIYGYVMMYRTSGYVRYLDFAKKLADYAMNHPNMPEDGVPYWDYGAAGEERDSSAASIMASALMELSQYVGAADRARYRAFAVKQLLALSSAEYYSEGDEVGHFLLKHGTGNKAGGTEIDTPLDYGDYYFLEALLRFRALKAREAEFAAVAAMLPEKAELPADEYKWRLAGVGRQAKVSAEKVLKAQIPDASDELYGEFWTTGNRSHYQARMNARMSNLHAMVRREYEEGKGRYIGRIEEYLTAFCEMKSWVLPAHDHADGEKGTFRGTWITTDLQSTHIGAQMACVLRLIGDRLDPKVVERVKENVERRVFAPLRREVPSALFGNTAIRGVRVRGIRGNRNWWIKGSNNWNAVCWDNVLCAALGLLDDPMERAYFVTAADRAANSYIAGGFAEDGYCSEGMGYWNYGFGHHLMMGRMLDKTTGGKFNLFRRPKQKLAAAYARAYTLCEGVSPAFADGNGAVEREYLELVDEYWPDLPKEMTPISEFPDGQVWLVRNSEGLSVAFKGGHNGELHNHNDIGSYYLVDRGRFVSGDPGGEEYTARTFSSRRYESKVLNSYGHPVPVVGGRLQEKGEEHRAQVVSKELGEEVATVTLDLTAAYDVKALKKLTRTFVCDRGRNSFTVHDRAEFTEPTAFEDCYVTFGDKANVEVKILKGNAAEREVEKIDNPGKKHTPHRYAWAFESSEEAEIEFTFKGEQR